MPLVVLVGALQCGGVLPEGHFIIPPDVGLYLDVPWNQTMLKITSDREILVAADLFI